MLLSFFLDNGNVIDFILFFASFFCSENYLVRWGSNGMPKEIEKLNNLQAVFTVSYCIYILEILPHAADMSPGFFPFPLLSFPSLAERSHMGHFKVFSWTLKILEAASKECF